MAGLSCATALHGRGHDVVVFDKGRGAGGRMSTRRLDTRSGTACFDHGAQYFTARDPAFLDQVRRWEATGHAARWPAAGADAWVGMPAMNAPVRAMADGLDVRWGMRAEGLSRDGRWRVRGDGIGANPFDAAIVAVPAEQVPALVEGHDPAMAEAALSTPSAPCWTVMVAYRSRVPTDRDRLTDPGPLASAVRNSAKPGREGPEAWVLQAGAEWSQAHIEDTPAEVEAMILDTFAHEIGGELPHRIATSVHRWRYARSGNLGTGALWNADRRLGVCGDWLIGPRIEAAWQSGQRLADRVGDGMPG